RLHRACHARSRRRRRRGRVRRARSSLPIHSGSEPPFTAATGGALGEAATRRPGLCYKDRRMPVVATGDPPAPSAWPASAGYVPRRAIKARPLGWFWQRALAFGALALALPIALVTARGTVDWPGRPFPGFFAMGNGIVPTVGLYSWTGL